MGSANAHRTGAGGVLGYGGPPAHAARDSQFPGRIRQAVQETHPNRCSGPRPVRGATALQRAALLVAPILRPREANLAAIQRAGITCNTQRPTSLSPGRIDL